jgi:ParG
VARSISESERAARLIEMALNGLPERDRPVVVRFLLRSWLDLRFGRMQSPGALETAVRFAAPTAIELAPATAPMPVVPSGGEHQIFPVRLPEEQHTALKAWCTEHGFSMATVVRGLVENFLRAQAECGLTGTASKRQERVWPLVC